MAASELATAFLETSLGTRLVVSFPACATTVADLKVRVSAEHAASFPHIGQITVKSFKVRRRGCLYHLTDSMAVRAAFHGIKGNWYLQAEAVPRSAVARRDAKCGTDIGMHDVLSTDRSVGHFIGGCTENMPPLTQDAACQGGGNLAFADTPLMNQEDELHESAVHVSVAKLRAHAPTRASLPPHVIANLSNCSSVGSQGETGQSNGRYAMPGVISDLGVAAYEDGGPVEPVGGQQTGIIKEPRGKKHFREEDETHQSIDVNCDGALISLICSRQYDGDKCKHLQKDKCSDHNSKSKRICGRRDGFLNEMDVNSTGRGDVAAHSSDDQMPKDGGALENSPNQDKGMSLHGKKQEVKSTKSVDEVDSSIELCNHKIKPITKERESNSENSTVCSLVNENDSAAVTEKHADRGIPQKKLVEQQDHLNCSTQGGNSLLKDASTFLGKACISGVLRNCNSRGTLVVHSESLSDCQYEESSRSFDLKCCKKSKCETISDQVDGHTCVCSEVEVNPIERASREKHDSLIKRCGTVSAMQCIDAATVGDSADPFTPNLLEREINSADKNDQKSDPLLHDLDDFARSLGDKPSYGRKEPWIAQVCNSESSKKGTDLLPSVESKKEGNSSEKEVMTHEEKQKTSKITCAHSDRTIERMQSADSLLSVQQKSSILEAKEGQRDLEKPCQNAEKCSEGTNESEVPLDDVSEKSAPLGHGSFNTPDTSKTTTSSDHHLNEWKGEGATSTDSTEQGACHQRRRQRVAVRKLPMSRVTKLYGFR